MNTGKLLFLETLLVLLSVLPGLFSCSSLPAEQIDVPVPLLAPPPAEAEAAPIAEPEPPPVTGSQAILAQMASLLSQGNFDRALGLFDQLESDIAESGDIRLLKASVLGSAGRREEARGVVEELISQEPDNIEALFVLSTLEGALGREREQRAILEGILKTEPNYVPALSALGNIALKGKSLRPAAAYFDKALAADPNHGEALIGRAGVYRKERKPGQAEALLNKAVSLYPQWTVPLTERARLYREAGFFTDALNDLNRAKKINDKDYWIAVDRGMVLVALNRKQEALPEFNRAIAMDPDIFIAYVYSAGIKDEIGDYAGAEHDYGVLTKLKPEYYFAFEGLGVQKVRKGLWAEARDAFMEAYKQAPETSYALLASLCWMRAGKATDPKQFLEQVLKKVDRESLEWYLVRLYHDLSGDTDAAVRIDREKDVLLKARMLFYLASYYDVRGNTGLANRYFLQVQELTQQSMLEWRLNEWVVKERNLKAF